MEGAPEAEEKYEGIFLGNWYWVLQKLNDGKIAKEL